MILFHNDYSEGCHEKVLTALVKTNMEQTPGYSEDNYCAQAAEKIRKCCGREDLAVHFLVGGTQANLTVIAAGLRPHQGVLGADSAHVNVHETGAIEATGHKVLWLPSVNGKIEAKQVSDYMAAHWADPSFEHTVQPGMVYISSPTEWGTLYSRPELEELSRVCRENGLYLFLDGARMGYGLMAQDNDVTLADLANLCDVFYIGGTKVGALFGEAVVISNPALAKDFRYVMKQRGGMLAKGRLLGVQFDALFEDDLYFKVSAHADAMAEKLRDTFSRLGYSFFMPPQTNQLFPILPAKVREYLGQTYTFIEMDQIDADNRVCRFCTSWATKEENVDALCRDLEIITERS
ncbi:MAG: aminotransferase class I/II-fold pyridoxal phosphate-dependent enzyme [Ruminococcaceae bacterium]|nr:aminotransferase class I/II-fold pyridoxal phosphate-dependent enzyme [Oscillospiraceae bacterium]